MLKRVLFVVALAVGAALLASVLLRSSGGVAGDAPTEDEMARSIGSQVMENVWRGHVDGRSGEITLVPKPHSFVVGDWDVATLGSATPTLGTTHSSPWDYLTRVPVILYGPGLVPAGEVDARPADIASLAPTYASLVGMDLPEAQAEPLPEPAPGHRRPPKVIFTVVIDGGGWNVLQAHPGAWPNIRDLAAEGTTYTNIDLGSSPSITAALHATFGTGAYPRSHGIPAHQIRDDDGDLVDAYLDEADPRFLAIPTMADLWDLERDNEPIVATVSFEGWHLGMIGHGAQHEGGDRDIAVLWEREEEHWWTNEEYYELPEYLQETDTPRLEVYEERLDGRDGVQDDSWFGHTLEELRDPPVRPGTPAFVRFTGDAVDDILREEPIGQDALTDVVWIEMKMPDHAGHSWNMAGPEVADVLRETDRQIARMKRTLDERVGRGNYLFAISADHGQQPVPDLEGGWRISATELRADIEDRFGPVVEKVTPPEIFLDMERIREEDVDVTDIARFVGTYTIEDSVPQGDADHVPPARLDERVFVGAFTTDYLTSLDLDRILSLGEGDFPEGDFVVEP